jgi:hypothetical protein
MMTERSIYFGGPGGFSLQYSLTNGILTLEKHVLGRYGGADYNLDFKAQLKRVASEPGKRLWLW